MSSRQGTEEVTSAIISPVLSPSLKREISAEEGGFVYTTTYRYSVGYCRYGRIHGARAYGKPKENLYWFVDRCEDESGGAGACPGLPEHSRNPPVSRFKTGEPCQDSGPWIGLLRWGLDRRYRHK